MFILIQENSMHKKFINHLWGIAFGLGLLLPFPMGIAIAQSNPTDAAPKPTTHSVNTGETPANTPFNTSHPETSGQPKAEASAILAPKHHLERGTALLRLGNPKGAAASFLRVIQTQPNNLTAHQQLRRALIETHDSGKLQESLPALIKTLNSHGHRNLALQRLGELRILEPSPEVLATLEQELQLNSALSQPNPPTTIWDRLRSLFGMAVLLGIAFIFSANRKKIDYRLVGWGMGLQFFFALIILWTPPGRWLFDAARLIIHRVLSFTDEGASFLFGNIYNGIVSNGASGPVQVMDGTTGDYMNLGLVFAFHILPTVIFFGSLMSVLYHLGVVQRIVKGFAWIMMRTMGTSGSESLSAASNIFVGQTEAPLVVRPFLDTMTVSELMAIMVGGFATVAGGVLAAYTRFGIDPGHLLAASVMSAPAALVVAKVMYPETQASTTSGESVTIPSTETSNIIDAAAIGATDGLKLALNVAAMLVAFIGLKECGSARV